MRKAPRAQHHAKAHANYPYSQGFGATGLMLDSSAQVGLELAKAGYDVVMTPGQAYYLDMVQDEAFQEPGASWAGTVPPHHTYTYEAVAEFPPELGAESYFYHTRTQRW